MLLATFSRLLIPINVPYYPSETVNKRTSVPSPTDCPPLIRHISADLFIDQQQYVSTLPVPHDRAPLCFVFAAAAAVVVVVVVYLALVAIWVDYIRQWAQTGSSNAARRCAFVIVLIPVRNCFHLLLLVNCRIFAPEVALPDRPGQFES